MTGSWSFEHTLDTPIYDALFGELHPGQDASGASGVDTSSWQGTPDFGAVASSGHQFVYIKASNNTNSNYPTTEAQFESATAAGLSVGLYHYADPSVGSAHEQADVFASVLERYDAIQGHLPPALDLEVGTGHLGGWAKAFLDRLRSVSAARRVMVYSSVSFFTDQIGESWMDNDVLLWLAHYGRTPGQPGYTSPRVAIHQYSQTGAVAGVAGHCDLNFALMPLHELEMDLTPDEHNMLVDLHNWISTPVQTWPDGSDDPFESAVPEYLTPMGYLRRANVEVRQTWNAVRALESPTTPTPVVTPPAAVPVVAPPALARAVQPRLSAGEIKSIAATLAGLLKDTKE